MNRDRSFNLLAYLCAEDAGTIASKICGDENISYTNVSQRMDFLESLLDDEPGLILFHTDIGEEEIIETLKIMNVDALYARIPVIIISRLDDNDSFALRLAEYEVISILTYENWKYQYHRLLRYLKSEFERRRRLHDNLKHSESKNSVDPLTGALNRFGAEIQYEHLVAYHASNGELFSLVMFDIDYFKKVNDIHGHDAGDQVLVGVSSSVKKAIRKDDAMVRFGGEEFIVLLSNTGLEAAIQRAETLRRLIASELYGDAELKITASFGVVQYSPGDSMNLLIEKADRFLYAAKTGGRNQVCSA